VKSQVTPAIYISVRAGCDKEHLRKQPKIWPTY
jgi:hypothetical protein